MQIIVRDNNIDQALKALKKKMQREGIFREMKLRGAYEKPSEKRARERAEAVRRYRKLQRKRLQREGLLAALSGLISGFERGRRSAGGLFVFAPLADVIGAGSPDGRTRQHQQQRARARRDLVARDFGDGLKVIGDGLGTPEQVFQFQHDAARSGLRCSRRRPRLRP